MKKIFFAGIISAFSIAGQTQPFYLPTANHAIFQKGGGPDFLAGTVGNSWESGGFGCVRSDGRQMHEGLDIKCLERDRHGEPTDPVMATAAGVVVYINNRPALSNYGRYMVLRHLIDGVEVYSLYAHLSEVQGGIKVGSVVAAGEKIAVMGRTTDTREGIGKDRAHVHFELDLFYSDHFSSWYKKHFPTEHNDHKEWNGENLVGFNPWDIFFAEQQPGFNLAAWLRNRPALCRVVVRKTGFSWLKRYPELVKSNPVAEKEGIAGYEMALDFNGLPFELIPRAASEIKGANPWKLISVNETECAQNPCRRLVTGGPGHWQLGNNGISLLELITN